MWSKFRHFSGGLFLLFFIIPAYADAGLPTIVFIMPKMIFLLLPIIFLEAIVLRSYLKIGGFYAFKNSALSNTASTIFGIPLAWLSLLLIQLLFGGSRAYGQDTIVQRVFSVTFQAPWLIPYENEFYWMMPCAVGFLMIPFFFVSWYIEGRIVQNQLPDYLKIKAYRATLYSNLVSYLFLEVCIFILLMKNVVHH